MLKNYLKLAFTVLARRKVFTAISLFGISFTLLVLMVATAMLDHIFAPQRPEGRLDRTVGVYSVAFHLSDDGRRIGPAGYAFHDRYLRNLPGAEETSIFETQQRATAFVNGRKISLYRKRTDGAFWRIHDFEFLEGGPITDEDEKNARSVAVINESTRKQFFGGSPAVGKPIRLDGQTYRVQGVVRNVPLTRLSPFADIWVPISSQPNPAYKTSLTGQLYVGLVLARSKKDIGRMRSEYDERIRTAQLGSEFKSADASLDTPFESYSRMIFTRREPALLRGILLAMAVGFMLLPAINLVSINLSRILERSSEIGIRKSFGASSLDLITQFVVENVILSVIGGLIGFVLAVIALWTINGAGFIPHADFQPNFRIFFYGLGIAVFFGILSGVYPAWRMSRLHPVEALRGSSS